MWSWAVRWCICPCSLATISKFRFRFFSYVEIYCTDGQYHDSYVIFPHSHEKIIFCRFMIMQKVLTLLHRRQQDDYHYVQLNFMKI